MNKILEKEVWTKNWAGNWSMCFCSFYGEMYTARLKKLVKKNFEKNLIVFEPASSFNYLPKNELSKFGNYLASLVIKDNSLARIWSRKVIRQTDKVLRLILKLDKKKALDLDDFCELREAVYAHVPPNFAIKKVADYLPAKLQKKNLPLFSRVRIYTEPVYNETDRILRRVYSQISKLTGVAEKYYLTLTHTELEEYLKSGDLPKLSELKIRYKGFAAFYYKGKQELVTSKQYLRLKESLVEKLADEQIKGTAAYPGVVKGRVRIVMDPSRVKVFNKGDILVAGMTRPEYLSLMKKSSAFVTDAGGMLSHAAITARELKKPCVVGTEIATKVFKDGDLVEVDANKGIVRRLGR